MTTADLPPGVVAGIDESDDALGAVRWAAEFAALHAVPLTIVHALPLIRPDADGERLLASAAAAARSGHPDLVVRTTAVRGAVATTLADIAQTARLLVVGAGADRSGLGGHTVRTVHRASCPVLVWRPAVARRTGKPLPVVVGVDDSEASARALAEAFDIARPLHAPLTVAHMWEFDAAVGMGDLGGQGTMDWPLLEVLESRQRERVDALVAPLVKSYPNAHVSTVFQDVGAARGLTELSGQAQVVVVGSHGRGRLAEAVLGSVSQNLIHHAECPVLVVR